MKKEIIGNATLYHGDCLEVLSQFQNKEVDAVITDPPYGVGLGETKNIYGKGNYYTQFIDSQSYVESVCVPVIEVVVKISKRVVVTPGVKNMWLYPRPDHTGCIYYPAGVGVNSWGFSCWQPVLFYGKDVFSGEGSRPDSFQSTGEKREKIDHPCPKPLGQMKKLIIRATKGGETVLDPFMGSGTTGVACGECHPRRKFIGIEIEEKYFDIACKRIEQAQKQTLLFPATM